MENAFYCGIAYGLFTAMVIGIIAKIIRDNRARIGAMYRTMDNFPDAIQPRLTPFGVVRTGVIAIFAFIFWFLMLPFAIHFLFMRLAPFVFDMIQRVTR